MAEQQAHEPDKAPLDVADERRQRRDRRQSVVNRRSGVDRRSGIDRRGLGERFNRIREQARQGGVTGELMEFIATIDEYRQANKCPFPSWSQVFEVICYLGYRKVARTDEADEPGESTSEPAATTSVTFPSSPPSGFPERRQGPRDRREEARRDAGERRNGSDRREGSLCHDRGPGKRRSDCRREAEEGRITGHALEFVHTMNEYKKVSPYPSWSEVFYIARHLGYRKVADRAEHINKLDITETYEIEETGLNDDA